MPMVRRHKILMGISLAFLMFIVLTAVGLPGAAAGRGPATGPLLLPDYPIPPLQPAAPPVTAGPSSTLTSSQLTNCLAVDATIHEAQANVFLTWTGTATAARLKLDINNARPGHSIYLNGTRIGTVPNWTTGAGYCATTGITTTFALPDLGVVRNGVNTLKITNDADPNDSWSIASGVLEVDGNIQGATYQEFGYFSTYPPQPSYQRAVVQIPANYDGSARPLVIGVHGYGASLNLRWQAIFAFGAEANLRGWLLAAPEMHGENPASGGGRSLGARAAQRDLIDTVNYVKQHYAVDESRIYLIGFSMGGQTAMIAAAKYPDVFAGVVEYAGFSSLSDWYDESEDWRQTDIANECGGSPNAQPFEYARRSPKRYALGFKQMPLAIVHGTADTKVLPHHAQQMYDAVSAVDPANLELHWYTGGHDDDPAPWGTEWAFSFLQQFTRPANPARIAITTDETRTVDWLQITQYGTAHWTSADVAFSGPGGSISGVITEAVGSDIRFGVASLGLPGSGSYVLERDNLATGEHRIDILAASGGSVGFYFTGGSWRIRLTPGLNTPTPSPTPTPTPTTTPTPTATPMLGQVGGAAYIDLSRDQVRQSGEPGVGGVTITLQQGATVVGTDTTDGEGHYQFTNLMAGSYSVTAMVPPAFTALGPLSQGIVVNVGGSVPVDFALYPTQYQFMPLVP